MKLRLLIAAALSLVISGCGGGGQDIDLKAAVAACQSLGPDKDGITSFATLNHLKLWSPGDVDALRARLTESNGKQVSGSLGISTSTTTLVDAAGWRLPKGGSIYFSDYRVSTRFRPNGQDWMGMPPETLRGCTVAGDFNARDVVELISSQPSKIRINTDNQGVIRYTWTFLGGGPAVIAVFRTGDATAIPGAKQLPDNELLQVVPDSKVVGQILVYPGMPRATMTESAMATLLDRKVQTYITVR